MGEQMSYDVSLTLDGGNGPIDLDYHRFNYTSNLSGFFNLVLEKGSCGEFNDIKDLNDKRAGDLVEMFQRVFREIPKLDYKDLKKYNPKNNWGSVHGAICFLAQLAIACAEVPNAKVKVWC
jgi:hypothetical protein